MKRVLLASLLVCASASALAGGYQVYYNSDNFGCPQLYVKNFSDEDINLRVTYRVVQNGSQSSTHVLSIKVWPSGFSAPLETDAVACSEPWGLDLSYAPYDPQAEAANRSHELFARQQEAEARKNEEIRQRNLAAEQARRDAEAEKERANQRRQDNQARSEQEKRNRDLAFIRDIENKGPLPDGRGCVPLTREDAIWCLRERERQLAKNPPPSADELNEREALAVKQRSDELANAQRQATEAQQAQQLLENQRYAAAIQESNQRQAEQERQERIESQRVARENYAESVAGMNRDLEKSRGVTRSMINNNDSLSDLISNSR